MSNINPGIEIYLDTIRDSVSHLHPEIEIMYILNGEAIFSLDDSKINLRKEDIVVINSGKLHSVRANTDALICRVLISPILFSEVSGDDIPVFWCNTAITVNENDTGLRTLLNKLLRRYLISRQKSDFFQMSLYYQLADYLYHNYLINSEDLHSNAEADRYEEHTRKALLYIHANYSQPLTLLELSDHLHLTSSYLSRYLKKNMGTNFKEYLTKIRLNHAVEDLLYSNKSVLRVAVDNGFANLTMFNKTFKDAYNTTPTEYKRMMRFDIEEKTKKREALERQILAELERTFDEKGDDAASDDLTVEVTERISSGIPFQKPWRNMINVGTIGDVLNSDIQKHLIQLKQRLDFRYVRFWGMFPETITIRKGNDFRFNFSRIDHAINFLVQNELKPYIQIGPKLRTIIDAVGSYSLYHMVSVDPDDYDEEHWKMYVDMLMRHFIAQFGVTEVESWIFEMWCPSPWDKPWEHWYTDEKYEAVYRAVKKYAPRALVGGCEFERRVHTDILEKSVSYWKAHDIIPDFVSFQLFPYIVQKDSNGTTLKTIVEADHFLKEARCMRQTLDNLELNSAKLFISLWNMTISNRSILNDTCFKGAWIMKNMLDIAGIADIAGYWLASDVYGEAYDSNSILFGGAGIITKDSIYKPAFHAFSFLKKAMETLVAKHENYAVTKDNRGNYLVLFHNMKTMNIQSILRNDENIRFNDLKQIFEDHGTLKLRLTLQDVEPGKYYIRQSSVNKDHGSVLDESTRWSQAVELKYDDFDYLQRICTPHVNIISQETVGHCLILELDIMSNEFGMIEIFQQF